MKRTILSVMAALVLLLGWLSIGIFKPEVRVFTEFDVTRSRATAFEVISSPDNIRFWLEGVDSVEAIVQHDDISGNTYRLETTDGQIWKGKVVGIADLEHIEMELSDERNYITVVAEFLPGDRGTRVHVTTTVRAQQFFRRSIIPFVTGRIRTSQSALNDVWRRKIETSPESPIGEWSGFDASGAEQLFSFKSDGTASWRVSVGENVFQLNNLMYQYQDSAGIGLLNLTNFESGPLAGKTLYGLVDLSRPDTLKMDAEIGVSSDATVRPERFTDSSVTYTRVR